MTEDARSDTASPAPARAVVRDHRTPPTGVMSRNLQTWLMLGIALVIMLIILITGHRDAPQPAGPAVAATTATPVDPERVRAYQQQRQDEDAMRRARQRNAAGLAANTSDAASQHPGEELHLPPLNPEAVSDRAVDQPPIDPAVDERRRRDATSLFADNIAFSRRGSASRSTSQASPPDLLAGPTPPPPSTPSAPAARTAPAVAPQSPGEQIRRLFEGTVIETVLTNRLDGTFTGPVNALVTTPVYSEDRQHVLVPAGARVLGTAAPVQAWGDSRLAVTFHRLVMPDGRTMSLQAFKGLNQVGETGLRDQVNRHYWQVFGASIAIGAISGLAQYDTRSDGSFTDSYRQSAGASLAASAARVLDRYLNILPTVTIREGHRIKVYLTADLELPAYTDTYTP